MDNNECIRGKNHAIAICGLAGGIAWHPWHCRTTTASCWQKLHNSFARIVWPFTIIYQDFKDLYEWKVQVAICSLSDLVHLLHVQSILQNLQGENIAISRDNIAIAM